MRPYELNTMLLEYFPELKDKFEEETSWQDGLDTGSTVVFEDVFMPYLEANVELGNIEIIERIYSFIEKLVLIDDSYVENVVNIAVLENIYDYIDSEIYAKYLKPNSLKRYKEF